MKRILCSLILACAGFGFAETSSLDAASPEESPSPAAWPMFSGPFGNYLPLPADGFEYVDQPSQIKKLWESDYDDFGYGKSLSNPFAKFFDLERRYPGTHPGSGGTPIVAEGIVFLNSFRPAGPVDDLQHPERVEAFLKRSRARIDKLNLSEAEFKDLAERFKRIVRTKGEDVFVALDAATGKLLWEKVVPGRNLLNGKRDIWKPSPAYLDGLVFALSTEGVVHALDIKTGEQKWQRPIEAVANRHHPVSFERDLIAVDGRVIVPGGIGLDAATGKELWRSDNESWQSRFANPAIWRHKGKAYLLYVDGHHEEAALRLVDPKDGRVLWSHATGGLQFDPPVVLDDIAFVTVGRQEVAFEKGGKQVKEYQSIRGAIRLSLTGPEKLWQFPEGDSLLTFPPGPDRGVRRKASAGLDGVFWYFPNDKYDPAHVFKIEAATGKILSKGEQSPDRPGVPTKAPYVYQIGDRLMFFPSGAGGDRNFGAPHLSNVSDLRYIGDITPIREENIMSCYEVFCEHPIADGKIYLRTYQGTIVCYDLRKDGAG